ncbi:MAG: V-type ATP synthase subunit F [Tissierellia bacterium]|nr:V-type ATP synthase subunit F [Tissierellia bacterium]
MKSLLLSTDHDVVRGLRLAGFQSVFCKDRSILLEKFTQGAKEKELGIIILTEVDFKSIEKEVVDVQLHQKTPLVVMIPGPNGLQDKDFIMSYIKASIGM